MNVRLPFSPLALASERTPPLRRILLVTSAFHMPRAARLFESAGLDVSAFPVDFVGTGGGTPGMLGFLPTAGALAQSQVALREFYGRLYYRMKLW